MCQSFEELHVVVSGSTGIAVRIRITGELDLASVDALDEVLGAAITAGAGDVEVDMSATRFCDSVGLCALATARERLGRQGRKLRIVAASHPVERVLELSGTSRLFGRPQPSPMRAGPRPRRLMCTAWRQEIS